MDDEDVEITERLQTFIDLLHFLPNLEQLDLNLPMEGDTTSFWHDSLKSALCRYSSTLTWLVIDQPPDADWLAAILASLPLLKTVGIAGLYDGDGDVLSGALARLEQLDVLDFDDVYFSDGPWTLEPFRGRIRKLALQSSEMWLQGGLDDFIQAHGHHLEELIIDSLVTTDLLATGFRYQYVHLVRLPTIAKSLTVPSACPA